MDRSTCDIKNSGTWSHEKAYSRYLIIHIKTFSFSYIPAIVFNVVNVMDVIITSSICVYHVCSYVCVWIILILISNPFFLWISCKRHTEKFHSLQDEQTGCTKRWMRLANKDMCVIVGCSSITLSYHPASVDSDWFGRRAGSQSPTMGSQA